MKKAPLFITIGVIALSVATYFAYEQFFVKREITPWELVPSSAVVVYEPSTCEACIDPVRHSSFWEVIRTAALFEKDPDSLRHIMDVLAEPRQGALTSLHVTKKDDFDFLFYVPASTTNDRKLFEAIIGEWGQKDGVRVTEHEFNKVSIHELTSGKTIFSWVLLGEVYVGSFTPFLVEDVIRVFNGETSSTFQQEIASVYKMPKLKNDAGNLYIHLKNFADWISVFVPNFDLGIIPHFGHATLLDVRSENEKNVVLNGFSMPEATGKSALSVFNDQSPTSFGLKQYISNRTVMFASFGISQGAQFGERLKEYPERGTAIKDTLAQLSTSLKVDFQELYNTINNEVGLCYVESGGQELSKILLVETRDAEVWLKHFNAMAAQLSEDTVFFERFSDYEVRQLPLYRLPEKIFSPFVTGFDYCYYTSLGHTVIMGENLEQLKSFLEDIDREDTWGKSVVQNRFLESTLLESTISLYINTPRIWNVLNDIMNDKWQRYIQEERGLLSQVGMGAVQFSNLNESYYTNISWQNKEATYVEMKPVEEARTIVTTFNEALSDRAFAVKTHVDKSNEMMVQDSLGRIYLVSSKGEALWSLQMNGPIIGDVTEVDFFKNGKLQYFFATPGTLHVIDRLGNYVEPYPLKLKVEAIEYAKVVDYDHSKNYRFLLSDKTGKLWMFDKEGNNLDGWGPRDVGDELATAASHHRIRGKDYMIAIRKDGNIFLMNRRGELMPGFPLNLEARPTGDYHIEMGNSRENTYFVIVSREGYRVKLNLLGKVAARETLLKTSLDARFSLVSEYTGKSYIIVRQESKGLTLLDVHMKELFTNPFMGMNPVRVRYYDFGAGQIYYVLTDEVQDLSYVYNARGDLLSSPPFESFSTLLRSGGDGQVRAYITYDKSLYIKPLN